MKNMTFIYTILDRRAEDYSQLLEFSNDAAALRAVHFYIKNHPESPIAMSPDDFCLVKLGEFRSDGLLVSYDGPSYLEIFDAENEVQ